MLLGGHINVYTDHKNLIFQTLSAQRVLRWKLYLDEYHINLTHIEGKSNVLADTFSRLPRMEKPTVGKKEASGTAGTEFNFRTIQVAPQDDKDVFFNSNNNECPELLLTVCRNEDTEVLECFLAKSCYSSEYTEPSSSRPCIVTDANEQLPTISNQGNQSTQFDMLS